MAFYAVSVFPIIPKHTNLVSHSPLRERTDVCIRLHLLNGFREAAEDVNVALNFCDTFVGLAMAFDAVTLFPIIPKTQAWVNTVHNAIGQTSAFGCTS